MSLVQLNLGGMAGLAVGLFAVAVAAVGYAHNDALAGFCAFLGAVSWLAYMIVTLDRYERARKEYPYH
jgi:hypothetical protein